MVIAWFLSGFIALAACLSEFGNQMVVLFSREKPGCECRTVFVEFVHVS